MDPSEWNMSLSKMYSDLEDLFNASLKKIYSSEFLNQTIMWGREEEMAYAFFPIVG